MTTQSNPPTFKMEAVSFSEMLVMLYQAELCNIFDLEVEGSRCNLVFNNDLPEIKASLSSTLNMEAVYFSETLVTIE
jgi:hypothetical protein